MDFLRGNTVYGDKVTDHMHVVFHFFPLPYHHNSFFVTQLVPFVYNIRKETEDVLNFSEYILKNQKEYSKNAVNSTEYEVQDRICRKSSYALSLYTYSQ
mmetsp:Transcript_32536/g.28804  ORF Transcript_32536/g.28804 Transcript_32536/m.28804 type:complete len:99 (+) Transcript_32536:154-450(+)